MELSSGTLLQGGKYKIETVLGQGGFGITYLAEQTNLGRKVCIKEFFMKEYGERTASPRTDSEETVLTGGTPVAKDSDATVLSDSDSTVLTGVSAVTTGAAEIMGRYREKFVKEARTIARLDHPGIVRIHDVFEENGTAYYVMDFIEGENLNELVKREGALSEERALGYIRQIGDALSYVHGHNIMHLDVKPANVIVRKSDGKAILIDFGTAKQYDSEGTQTSTTPVGLSVGYAPIEMTKPGGVQTFSPETDVYSLGATLYYLVTGQNPPDASERMEMIMEGEKFQLPESISSSTAEVIEQSMQARKKRIQTVDGFLDLLQSDGVDARQKEAEAAAEKARSEAERQEALRKEQERAAAAEKKRQAEEQAKKDAETKALIEQDAKRIQTLRQETEEAKRKGANGLLIGISVFFLVSGLVMFILAVSNVLYNPWPSSFNPFGYIGFGLFFVSLIFSIVCLSRKAASAFPWFSTLFSFIMGFICLYDAIDEDNIIWFPFSSNEYYSGQYSVEGQSIVFDLQEYGKQTSGQGTVLTADDLLRGTTDVPFQMPRAVYLAVAQPGAVVADVYKSENRVSGVYNSNSIYYSINGNRLTIYNLQPGTDYNVYFDPGGYYQYYGVFDSFCYYSEPNNQIYQFRIPYPWE